MTSGSENGEEADRDIEEGKRRGKEPYLVSALIKNESDRNSTDVLQIYIKNLDSALAVPNPQLCGFTRVHLSPGEEARVTVEIPEEAFMVVDQDGKRICDGSRFAIYAGTSQPDRRSIELSGKKPVEIAVTIG